MSYDHRDVGRILDLFHFQEEAVGSVFWHPNGWFIYSQIQNYIRSVQKKYGYKEVNSPQMVRRSLWEKSGHWDNYKQNMFCVEGVDGPEYALKPMNCACHIQIFNQRVVSWRELPLRYAEFGRCMRNEPSGSLSGLMRVRSFVQDDAHIFCAENQIESEVAKFSEMAREVYSHFGFPSFQVRFSGRPENSAGSDEQWLLAEEALKRACLSAKIDYEFAPGEGAFYGPKLEFMIKDHAGKEWQCGTIQVDFVLPERLDVEYRDKENNAHRRPVILHRAILGSFERFIGILLENHGCELPSWLHPRKLAIINLSGEDINPLIDASGLSIDQIAIDESRKNLSGLIKQFSLQKYSHIIVYGKKEKESGLLPIASLSGERVSIPIDKLKSFIMKS